MTGLSAGGNDSFEDLIKATRERQTAQRMAEAAAPDASGAVHTPARPAEAAAAQQPAQAGRVPEESAAEASPISDADQRQPESSSALHQQADDKPPTSKSARCSSILYAAEAGGSWPGHTPADEHSRGLPDSAALGSGDRDANGWADDRAVDGGSGGNTAEDMDAGGCFGANDGGFPGGGRCTQQLPPPQLGNSCGQQLSVFEGAFSDDSLCQLSPSV